MAEYISKAKFVEVMRKKARNNFDLYYADKSKHYHDKAIGYQTAADEAHDFPAEDVQPVKRGRWLPSEACITIDCQVCSECRSNISMDRFYYDYCPVCGARMDGDTNG